MGCIRPCGIQSGQVKSLKEELKEFHVREKLYYRIAKSKLFVRAAIITENQIIYDMILRSWITPAKVEAYIQRKKDEALEARKKEEELAARKNAKEANAKSFPVPKKKKNIPPETGGCKCLCCKRYPF